VVLVSGLPAQHLMWELERLFINCDVFVLASPIKIFDALTSVIALYIKYNTKNTYRRFVNFDFVAFHRLLFHYGCNLWLLGKDFFMKEPSSDAESLDLFKSNIEELTSLLIKYIVITNHDRQVLRIFQLFCYLLLIPVSGSVFCLICEP